MKKPIKNKKFFQRLWINPLTMMLELDNIELC